MNFCHENWISGKPTTHSPSFSSTASSMCSPCSLSSSSTTASESTPPLASSPSCSSSPSQTTCFSPSVSGSLICDSISSFSCSCSCFCPTSPHQRETECFSMSLSCPCRCLSSSTISSSSSHSCPLWWFCGSCSLSSICFSLRPSSSFSYLNAREEFLFWFVGSQPTSTSSISVDLWGPQKYDPFLAWS